MSVIITDDKTKREKRLLWQRRLPLPHFLWRRAPPADPPISKLPSSMSTEGFSPLVIGGGLMALDVKPNENIGITIEFYWQWHGSNFLLSSSKQYWLFPSSAYSPRVSGWSPIQGLSKPDPDYLFKKKKNLARVEKLSFTLMLVCAWFISWFPLPILPQNKNPLWGRLSWEWLPSMANDVWVDLNLGLPGSSPTF